MVQTATVTLKKGSETWTRDLLDESGIKAGHTYVIGGEPWVVDKIHRHEPEAPKQEAKAKPAHKAKKKSR